MQQLFHELISEMNSMTIIDSHEHLPFEAEIIGTEADVFSRIFCHYSITCAISAGMPDDRDKLKDVQIPLSERWKIFKPYLNAIKDTGYARVAQITARDIYNIEEINDDTFLELSRRVQELNKPGLYDRILKQKCRIERVINQGSWNDGKNGYAPGVYRGFLHLDQLNHESFRVIYERYKNIYGGDFEDAGTFSAYWLKKVYDDGFIGIKLGPPQISMNVDEYSAEGIFRKFLTSTIDEREASYLGIWLTHKVIENAPLYNFVVAVHCGLNWNCWNDFSSNNPIFIIPLLLKYKKTVFDLYHLGLPWAREMITIGNQYPNANLNLVWSHQISPFMSEQLINELIDLVPVNKIIGFGGDNVDGPEKTYGVLQMTKENIARALAVRVSRHLMTTSRAVDICKAWLYDNPRKIYGLE